MAVRRQNDGSTHDATPASNVEGHDNPRPSWISGTKYTDSCSYREGSSGQDAELQETGERSKRRSDEHPRIPRDCVPKSRRGPRRYNDTEQVTIYALADPRTHEIRYVGRTRRNPEDRLKRHIEEARTLSCYRTYKSDALRNYRTISPLHAWILWLAGDGLRPEVRVIGVVLERDAHLAEKGWIQRLDRGGYDLVNSTYRATTVARNTRSIDLIRRALERSLKRKKRRQPES